MGILDRMNFRALDENFNATGIIDAYDSLIWTEKYNEPGDFEIRGPINKQLVSLLEDSSYIFNSVTSTLMVIEKPDTEYNDEDGNTLTITGRSISSVLDRRVLQKSKTILNPTDRRISRIVYDLILDGFIFTTPERVWSRLMVGNTTSPATTAKLADNVAIQLTLGSNLLDVVKELSVKFGLGFKCEFSVADSRVNFLIYEGVNRSIQGSSLLIFSDLYDNLRTARESISYESIKNAVLVIGSAEDANKQPKLPQYIADPSFTGINRREMFLQAQQEATIYNADGTQTPMTDPQYIEALKLAGTAELDNDTHKAYREYDGEIVETQVCKYGENFNLGDIVAFRLPHHTQTYTARLDTITFSDDVKEGKTLVPKFNYNV